MLGAGWTYSEYSAGQNEGPETVSGLFAFIPPPKGSGCSRSGYNRHMLTLSEKAIVDYLGVMNHVAPGGYGAFLARHSRFWPAAPLPEAFARGTPRQSSSLKASGLNQ